MGKESETLVFENAQELAEGFALWFYNFINDKPIVNVALSGGSTPKLFFQVLSQQYRERVDWSKIQFFWGDERCVPPDHEESNYHMARKYLLDHVAVPAQNIHRVHGESAPGPEAGRYGQLIADILPQTDTLPVFDLVILGLGADGHTASIFPDQINLIGSDDLCQVATHPESGQQRITLTGRVINRAVNTCFLVAGGGKSGVIAEILNKTGDWERYPASYIQPGAGGTLHWFLDREAAAGIQR